MARVPIGEVELEWHSWGPRPTEGHTIVLLHEGLGCVALWRDVPRQLAEATGLCVLAYSRQGYGGSSPCVLPRPMDYMQREAIETLPRVLDALEVDACVLVGHSDGASIASVYAGAHRDPRVRGVVLVAPHFFCEPISVAAIAQAKVAFERANLREKLARYHGDNVDCAFRGWNDAWLDPRFERWNIESYLSSISVPILAIQGRDDQYGTLAQLDALDTVTAPVRRLVLDNCRHAPFWEQPDATLGAIVKFVQTVFHAPSPPAKAGRP